MEAFKEAWLSIDRYARGYITTEDLVVYMRKQNYDDSFVTKWKKLFDSGNTGVIRLEEFCDVLGLNAAEIQQEATAKMNAGLPSDVIYISGDMSLEWQLKVVEITKEALRDSAKMNDVPQRIKKTLDRLYGQLWHVVVTQGQFWSHFGHEPTFSFVFKIEKQVFIIFKTTLI